MPRLRVWGWRIVIHKLCLERGGKRYGRCTAQKYKWYEPRIIFTGCRKKNIKYF